MRSNESAAIGVNVVARVVSTLLLIGTPRSPPRMVLASMLLVTKSMNIAASFGCAQAEVMLKYCEGLRYTGETPPAILGRGRILKWRLAPAAVHRATS